ncbi:MAG: alpha/beta hydrolase [Ornithinimicrobium sp.]
MPVVQLNETTLEYIERGQGDPVVLVHGTLGDLRSWEPQIDAFAETYRTIAYSRRYHHPNPCTGHESDYSAVRHADDLAELMTALGLGSAHIVGESYGAYTALFLAARHPSRVRTLVLGEPPILPLLEHNPEGRELRDAFLADVWGPVGATLRRGEMEAGVRMFADAVVEEGAFDQMPPEVHTLIMDNAREFTVETSSPDFWTPLTCEDAGRVAAPTLLLSGEQSLKMFQLIVDELARCLPNNEFVTIPDSNHDMPGGNPEVYNETVLAFLAEQVA